MFEPPVSGSRRPSASSCSAGALRRFAASLAVLAVITALVAAPSLPDGDDVDGGPAAIASNTAEVGLVSPRTISFLDGESSSSRPQTLADLRRDVLGSSAPLSLGSGIDVAVIDTGVSPVAGLDGENKVLHGPDLSPESSSPDTAFLDTYGHGTHVAGIIAGNRHNQPGIAPAARIVSLKVAGHDGVTTVPQVIAAIDWVVEHRQAAGLNIRVMNLSLGQSDVSSHVGDALSAAVERAWSAGIVVVVAAGNDGATRPHLDSPALSPYVVAVGAVDPSSDDDRDERSVPSWSGRGDQHRTPDLVAPGRSIASYRVPGSAADSMAPIGRYGTDLFLGSGTSQSAAVTSGVAAALLGAHPELSADEVKATLMSRAFRLDEVSTARQGKGHIGRSSVSSPVRGTPRQQHPSAFGPGTGLAEPSAGTWSGGTWSGTTWSGSTWTGTAWSGGTWSGGTWSGGTWSGGTWSGGTWSGGTWSGGTWSGTGWE